MTYDGMKIKPHVWKCTSCKAEYIEDSSQIVYSGISELTVRNLRQFIEEHEIKTGHKGFNLT
jgi:hypothetical protein